MVDYSEDKEDMVINRGTNTSVWLASCFSITKIIYFKRELFYKNILTINTGYSSFKGKHSPPGDI